MHRCLLAFLFIVGFLPFSRGQSVYYTQQDDSWEFRYSSSAKADPYTNQLLKQLALAHLKIPEHTKFTFFFNYGASVGFQQSNLLDVSLSLTPSTCTGDVEVRDFDLQKILVPANCSFKLLVINPVKGEVFSTVLDRIPLAELLAGYKVASFPDSLWTVGCKVVTQFRGFRFDEPSYLRIEKELYAIRDYDAAASLADTLEKQLRQSRIRLHVPQEAFRTYVFCNKGLYLLNKAAKTKTEIVPGKDPRGLLAKTPVINYRFEDLKEFLIDEGIEGPFSGNAYLMQAKGFGFALSDALKLAQTVDYYSSPFYYRLYSNSSSAGQLADAKKTIMKFAESRKFRKVDFRLLSKSIVDEFIEQGKKLMADGRFSEAVDLLASAERFSRVNPTTVVPLKLGKALSDARSGLTASYIRMVQKALDNNLPTLADKYLTEAMLFASRNNSMNTADSAGFAGLYGVLTGKNIQAGFNYLERKNFQAALAEFDKALAIATQFKLTEVRYKAENGQSMAVHGIFQGMLSKASQALNAGSVELAEVKLKEAIALSDSYPAYQPDKVTIDSLNKRINLVFYNTLVKESANLVLVSDYENAISKLLTANELSHNLQIPHSAFHDSITIKAGIPRINALLSEGRLKLWAGDPEAALNLAGKAAQLSSALELNGRQDIGEQNASLLQLADESLCSRVKGELTSLISQAGESYRQNKFERAAVLVLQAREMIYSKAACGLNPVELNKLTMQFQHPVRWNEMVKNAGVLIAGGEYIKGIEMIQQAGAVFNYYRLDTLGLNNTGLFELAITSGHLPLIRHATGHYIAREGYEQALQLLDRMRLLGSDPADANELQESLARVLAQRDMTETELPDLKLMLKTYTRGDKWYKRFADVYRFHIENN